MIVSEKESLFSKELSVKDINLIAIGKLERSYRVKVKIRLQHKEADAKIIPQEYNKAKIVFDEPQISVAPGQSAVFYSGDIVLGGGIIE
ncbi:aminomethyltransferase beta-barrel domain-containing protein [Thermodesulfobacteriota bacterium]